MKSPKNQLMEVFNLLLTSQVTSFEIIKLGILNPTARISQLRSKGVDVICTEMPHINKFGRKCSFGVFKLANKKEANKIYKLLNN
jgi:hypothetical protein